MKSSYEKKVFFLLIRRILTELSEAKFRIQIFFSGHKNIHSKSSKMDLAFNGMPSVWV
jgi:hypothetical protein